MTHLTEWPGARERPRVRWDALFADLEAQMASLEAAELDGEVADRTRREAGLVRFVDRLRGSVEAPIRVTLFGSVTVAGTLTSVGCDWLLVAEQSGGEALVPLAAVMSVSGLGPGSASAATESVVDARLDLRIALRSIARNRAEVTILLIDGSARSGTIDRVGADHLELAEHPVGEPRRHTEVRAVGVVPLSALAAVRSR